MYKAIKIKCVNKIRVIKLQIKVISKIHKKKILSRVNSKCLFFSFFFSLFINFISPAQDPQFTASVNKNPVSVNDQFQLTYTINTSATNFIPPSFKDFNVIAGPMQSSSMQIINGAMSQSVTLTYYLQPKSEGTFRIDPATINGNGKRLQSNALTLTVVKGSSKPQSQNQPGGGDDNSTDEALLSKNIFLKASVSKSNVLQGEAVLVTYKLYTRVNVVNYTIEKLPAYNGFWSQELKMPERLELRDENINGINYKVGVLKKVILFPQQSGALALEPMQGTCIARVQQQRKKSNSPFDIFNDPFFSDPFFGMGARDVNVALKSEAVKINVAALPSTSDSDFKGSVGKFAMEASIDKNNTKANDAVNIKIKISGKGNIKLIEPPSLNIPEDIESYEPKVNENISVSEGGVTGSKTFEYLMIPRHGGEYKIDPVNFTYYDIDKHQYVKLTSGEFNLKVEGSKGDDAGSAVAVQNKADFKLLGKDIRFIKTSVSDSEFASGFFGSWLFYVLLLLPFVFIVLAAIYKRKRYEMEANVKLTKSRNATRMAQKRLAIAKKLLDDNKTDKFYEEIYKALNIYCTDKLSIGFADLSKENLRTSLLSQNVNEGIVNTLIQTIETCEMARFAASAINNNPKDVYNNSVQIITKIEDELN